MREIKEQLTIPIKGEYDVIVTGGGIAGVSAALSSARNGAKTLLIEKQFLLGGLATAGLVTIYLSLCDGNGHQVSFGIAEELLRLSIKHGYESACGDWEDKYCPAWLEGGSIEEKKKKRFEVQFNANLFAILCEKLLIENGVEILYGTSICSAITENSKITAVITQNKSGRVAYTAKSFVDASGDADLCFLAGEKTVQFKQGNVLASWYYEHLGDKYRLRMLGFSDVPDKYKTNSKDTTKRRYIGLSGEELTEMMINSHSSILNDFLKKGGITETHALGNVATTPQIRMTRRIDGSYTMNDEEQFKRFDDSIGMISDWRKAGPVYEIPFSTLYGNNIKNLITCGRSISVTEDMWDISRVIPACAVTGQAAGTAAAMSDDFSQINIAKLQEQLIMSGVILHTTEIL